MLADEMWRIPIRVIAVLNLRSREPQRSLLARWREAIVENQRTAHHPLETTVACSGTARR